MSTLVALTTLTTLELRAELAQGITLLAERLTALAAIWAELERRGEDLSDLRRGINEKLPLIASGRLAAEAVVAFAGRRAVLRALEGVPLERQRQLAAGECLAVIDPATVAGVTTMPLASVPAAALNLIFAAGEIRSPTAQRLALRPRRISEPPAPGVRRHFQPHFNPATGLIQVGRMAVRLADLLAELARAAGLDRPPTIEKPNEYVEMRVRLVPEEMARLQTAARRADLPDWEMARKALRAFGLI